MSIFDKFINAIKLNDDYDEDEDDFFDEEDPEEFEEIKKPGRRFFQRAPKNYADDEFEEAPASAPQKPKAAAPVQKPARTPVRAATKVTPMRKKATGAPGMGVCVIKPTKIEDFREIADTLLSNTTVVLNLEGLDVELAQRIIDFSSGSCYAIDGGLQKVSSYIFIMTPSNVEISGDIQDILNGAFPTMRSSF